MRYLLLILIILKCTLGFSQDSLQVIVLSDKAGEVIDSTDNQQNSFVSADSVEAALLDRGIYRVGSKIYEGGNRLKMRIHSKKFRNLMSESELASIEIEKFRHKIKNATIVSSLVIMPLLADIALQTGGAIFVITLIPVNLVAGLIAKSIGRKALAHLDEALRIYNIEAKLKRIKKTAG